MSNRLRPKTKKSPIQLSTVLAKAINPDSMNTYLIDISIQFFCYINAKIVLKTISSKRLYFVRVIESLLRSQK